MPRRDSFQVFLHERETATACEKGLLFPGTLLGSVGSAKKHFGLWTIFEGKLLWMVKIVLGISTR